MQVGLIVGQHPSSDRDGFAPLQAWLLRLTARYRVPMSEREDRVQEALLALLREHPDWPTDEPETWLWLRRIAHNLARNVLPRRQRHRPVSQDEQALILDGLADPFPPDDEDADAAALPSSLSARVWAVVKSELGEVDRDIFTLFVAGLDYAEIAERLGLTPDHVRVHCNRAARKVRIRLGFPANPDCVDWWGG